MKRKEKMSGKCNETRGTIFSIIFVSNESKPLLLNKQTAILELGLAHYVSFFGKLVVIPSRCSRITG